MKLEFSHCGIFVEDVQRSVDFYTRFLGFVAIGSGRLAGSPNTIQQISFRVDSLTTLKRLYARVRQAGSLVTLDGPTLGPLAHGDSISVYFGDPDNNRIELFIDTPWHIPQPIRVLWDPRLTDEEILRHVETHARAQPGFCMKADWTAQLRERLAEADARLLAQISG
jgi:catechol 2,3-dioxygenase-like lactoylglutathione lyase family enzyme